MRVAAGAHFSLDRATVFAIVHKEAVEFMRSRWFVLFTLAFAGLALAVSYVSFSGVSNLGFAGFGRTSAGLVNLILLVLPLMALFTGAMSLASERDRGTLPYLLAQPVSRAEVFLGKYVGLALPLLASLVVGFGAAGVLLAIRSGGDAGPFLWLVGLSLLLALGMLSAGFLLSALSTRGSLAVGTALLLWLLLVFLGDLGLMGTTAATGMGVRQLLALALANPLQVFRTAAILRLRGDLEVLGPAGMYASDSLAGLLTPLLVGLLVLWVVAPLAVGMIVFARRSTS